MNEKIVEPMQQTNIFGSQIITQRCPNQIMSHGTQIAAIFSIGTSSSVSLFNPVLYRNYKYNIAILKM
jgi:hypothetical protein